MRPEEKRQAPRSKAESMVTLYDPKGQLVIGVGRLLDLSVIGAKFESSLRFKIGQTLQAQFQFPQQPMLNLDATVIWTHPHPGSDKQACGLKFVSAPSRDLEIIRKWVQERGGFKSAAASTAPTAFTIGRLPGDGVGPECLREGVKVLEAAAAKCRLKIDWVDFNFGGERYLKTGEILPESAFDDFRKLSAIYLGAIGHPDVKPGVLEQGLLLKIRFGLDQYINLRPVTLYPGVWTPLKDKGPEHVDFVVVRENTEGGYVGVGGFFKKGTPDEVAQQLDINTRKGVERCIRYAFEYCRKRNRRKKLTMVDKANVLTYGHDLWTRTFQEVGQEYPGVEKDHAFVDATCMWFVKNPEWFDVIVTNNMFGDIITDLGAMIQGGLGVAAGGNINPQGVSMFEPIHGSAPKYTGKNVINPIATVAAGAMMLQVLGAEEASQQVDQAIRKVLSSGKLKSMDAGKMGATTSEVGDLIANAI